MLTSQRFNENRWRPLTEFLLKILENVSNSGSIAGIAAPSRGGSTLKGTEVSKFYEYFKYIFVTIPEIFVPLIYIYIYIYVCVCMCVCVYEEHSWHIEHE